MLHVVLHQPQIPPNTGNVMRLCVNTGAHLHLVEPLGFDLSDARLRRAGLDYRHSAVLTTHPTMDSALELPGRPIAFTTSAARLHSDVTYEEDDVLWFGPEQRGLPPDLLERFPADHRVRLPMVADSRSLNLSNAVAVALYEAWRQLGYPGSVAESAPQPC